MNLRGNSLSRTSQPVADASRDPDNVPAKAGNQAPNDVIEPTLDSGSRPAKRISSGMTVSANCDIVSKRRTGSCVVNPNVAYPRQGKTRQSAQNVSARRLGQDEQYSIVCEILSETSTLVPPQAGLSRERSGFCRFGYATLGLR
jgi:hypothetical protein